MKFIEQPDIIILVCAGKVIPFLWRGMVNVKNLIKKFENECFLRTRITVNQQLFCFDRTTPRIRFKENQSNNKHFSRKDSMLYY